MCIIEHDEIAKLQEQLKVDLEQKQSIMTQEINYSTSVMSGMCLI